MNWDSGALPQSRPPMPGSSRDNDRFWFRDDTVLKQDRAYRGDGQATQRGTTDGGESDSDGLMDSLRDGAGTVAGAVSDAAGSLRDSVSDLTDRLAHGTEAFSDEARARILSARRAARDARDAAEAAMNRGARAGSNLFEDQPLVVGALAIALGAAIGGILPRTRMEDEALGESSDRLFAEAQAVFQEERAKVRETLGNAAEEARETVRDAGSELLSAGKSVGNETADRLASALTRAVDGNGTPARRQVPGNSGA